MANMSYCRFGNTLEDVRDCLNALNDYLHDDEVEISSSEIEDATQLFTDVAEFLVQNNITRLDKDFHSEIVHMIKFRGKD